MCVVRNRGSLLDMAQLVTSLEPCSRTRSKVDSGTIRVHASGTTSEPTGTVQSWAEYWRASHAA
jgi:hypothetical protein